jgi:lipopolysaccharide biosynthesis glycosyltransferase
MSSRISVALCADKNIEVSLHVTLYSLMNSSQCPIDINLIQKGYNRKDLENIHKTLRPFAGKYQLNIVGFNESPLFSKFHGLHGSQFNFTKLLLADLLPIDRVLYLDSDLSIGKDLSEVFSLDLNGFTIGAVASETIASSLRSDFYQSIGMNKDAKYFNSGIMVIDLKKWREQNITSQCLNFANKYADRLKFGDEAILNCIFHENFQTIDNSFNYPLYPNSDLASADSACIFHFVGSPKPFDLMGEFVHTNYSVFHNTLVQTYFRAYKSYSNLSIRKLNRTMRLSRSYYKCLLKHVSCRWTRFQRRIHNIFPANRLKSKATTHI